MQNLKKKKLMVFFIAFDQNFPIFDFDNLACNH